MRIIAGTARGRTLVAPEGMDTRPTSDRTRESLFNILAARVSEARVLDLFTGSGALAAESLSRGAQYVMCADISPEACAAARKNCALKGVSGRADVMQCDWERALSRAQGPFDIVFLDPPYAMVDVYGRAFALLCEKGLLAPDGVVVMEHEKDANVPLPDEAEVYDERKYGKARVKLVRRRQE